jgi:hypothetical protein
MADLRKPVAMLGIAACVVGLSACASRHQIQRLPNQDGSFILLVDYVTSPFKTQDVIVSLQEKQGIASEVAVFKNIHSFNATWLGPEDINICQVGTVQDYKTFITLNAHDGNHSFHIHYDCSPSGAINPD